MRKEKIRMQIMRDKEVKMKHILSDIEEEEKQQLTASNFNLSSAPANNSHT